jgi:hypothetical protein
MDALVVGVNNPEYVAAGVASNATSALFAADPAEAHRLGRDFLATGVDPYWANMILIHAAIRRRSLEDARTALDGLLAGSDRGRRIRASTLSAEAAVVALEGDVAKAKELFREAERLLRDLGLSLAMADAQLDMAFALAGTPDGGAFAVDALAAFEKMGARPLAEQARALLDDGTPMKSATLSVAAEAESRVG